MTRDRNRRRSKANKFPRKRSIRFKSPETVALINFLSFFANLPENSTNTNGESLAWPLKSHRICFAMMRDPYGHHTRTSHKIQMPWLSDRGCSTKGTLTLGRDGHFVHIKITTLGECGAKTAKIFHPRSGFYVDKIRSLVQLKQDYPMRNREVSMKMTVIFPTIRHKG